MSKVDREYLRQHRLVQDDPAGDPFSVPEFAARATEQRRMEQLPWPRNLFGEPASIAELLAEAAQLSEQIGENPTDKTDPPPRRSPSLAITTGLSNEERVT
jgi:hypothetical protein